MTRCVVRKKSCGCADIVDEPRAGAFAFALSSNASNSGIPDAARVASGPGEIACTRRAKFRREVADRTFKRGFGNAHTRNAFAQL